MPVSPGSSTLTRTAPVVPGRPTRPPAWSRRVTLTNFTYAQTILANYPQNIAPISEYFTDLENGTLPQVAEIDAASDAGLDEHGSDSTPIQPTSRRERRYTATTGQRTHGKFFVEQDSAFIFTYDESGGLYDHVPPQPTVSPDGIPPIDLPAGDSLQYG